jgi:hypothetical protein
VTDGGNVAGPSLTEVQSRPPWYPDMRKSDLTCPECHAGYRRIELISKKGVRGEFRCLFCDHILEVFDGCTEIAIRLTVQPKQTFDN